MAKQRKQRPSDPAEAARKRWEERRDPAKWGVNREALGLAANGNVETEPETRANTARAKRYDWLALFLSRGSIGVPTYDAVRRLEADMAVWYRLTGGKSEIIVDGARGHIEGITAKSFDAGDKVLAVFKHIGDVRAKMLAELSRPALLEGRPVNNWRAVVERFGYLAHRDQSRAVVQLCQSIAAAYADMDRQPRRAA